VVEVPPHVVLVGLPGSGKSVVGARVAGLLGRDFCDADEEIVEQTGRPIGEIFAQDGEAGFRAIEARTIAELLAGAPLVLALGGGAVLDATTRERLAGHYVVWLQAPVDVLLERLDPAARAARPLLAGDAAARLAELAEVRAPLYAAVATVVVDVAGRDADDVASAVAAGVPVGETA
jgi:shikimate kinase